jgi:signal transduction histidine kinase
MIEQSTRGSDVSTVSLTIQQIVGANRRNTHKKGVEHSLFLLSQYALAATDVTRLLEKGAGIILNALPLAFVVIAETNDADEPFCIRATAGNSAEIVNALCHRRHTLLPTRRSIIADNSEIHFSDAGKQPYTTLSNPRSLGNREGVTLISGKNKPFGLLLTCEKERRLTEDEIQFIRASADVLAIAIDRIEAQEASSRCEELVKRNLEYRIQERSEQLLQTNIRLTQSIEQYKQTEAALRRSEEDLRSLSAQLIEVGEQERKRIACDLHDGISQAMTSIKFRLECGLMQLSKGAMDEGIASITNVIPSIQQAIQEVRRISMDLRPSMLDDIGILAAIEWYCKEYQQTYQGIRVLQNIDVREPDIEEPLKLVIFRVIQEALHNIAKHSNANVARLELQCAGRSLVLRIVDNGNGFAQSPQSAKPRVSGLGLRSMRERVEQSVGIFNIASRLGAGTTVEASWPLAAAISVADQPLLHRVQG